MDNTKYIIYARKSTEKEDNQIASISDQLEVLKRIARERNLNVVDILTETASAKNPGRPIFKEMMERIQKGEANAILCWKYNRLARNFIDGGLLSYNLTTNKLREIHTSDKVYYPKDNVLLLSIEMGMATQFSLDLGKDVIRGMTQKASRGLFPGRAPIGYLNDKMGKKGYSGIIPDQDSFLIIKKCWQTLLEQRIPVQQLYKIAVNEWNLKSKEGTIPSRSRFYCIFKNPIYYGNFKWKDTTYVGTHEAMITEDQFWEAQEIVQSRSKDAPRSKFFAFTGHMKCGECGSSITAESKTKIQKNGNVHDYTYYRCIKYKNKNCTQKCVREEDIEKEIISFLESIEIPDDFHVWAMNKLKKENEEETEINRKLLETAQRGYDNAVVTLSGLIDMRASGKISEDVYMEKQNHWNYEKDKFSKEMVKQQNNLDTWLEKADRKLTLAETAKKKFESLKTAKDKKIFVASIGSNLYLKDKTISVSKENTLTTLKVCKKEIETIKSSLEPNKTQELQVDINQLYDSNPTLCAYPDLNRN